MSSYLKNVPLTTLSSSDLEEDSLDFQAIENDCLNRFHQEQKDSNDESPPSRQSYASEDEDTIGFFDHLCPETDISVTDIPVNEDMSLVTDQSLAPLSEDEKKPEASLLFLEHLIGHDQAKDAPKQIEPTPFDLSFEDQLAVLNVQSNFLHSLTDDYRRRVVSRLVSFVVENDQNVFAKPLDLSNCFLRTRHVEEILIWLYEFNIHKDVESIDLSNNNLTLLPAYPLLEKCTSLYRLYLKDNLFQGLLDEQLKRDTYAYRRRIFTTQDLPSMFSHYGNPDVVGVSF
jgi:hypothetical protein